ncbi:MAG: methyltransferase domain-containing protein [Candidatus Dormibacteraeota bacterium]|nr:methyltransferase domain-containing protein [Candidatus Dormibacteraeota bacterium]
MSEDVRERFAAVAGNYASSSFHAGRAGLDEVVALAGPQAGDLVLDVATGTGNTALVLAPSVARVTGLDLTSEMLAQARRLQAERGVGNADWVLGDAEDLPFASGSFDLYTARAAPHHFQDLEAALAEAARVLRPGGRACFIDCSPPPEVRDLLHQVEVRRDPSHVLSRTVEEWTRLLEAAGFEVELAQRRELDWDNRGWMANMAVPAGLEEELAAAIESAAGPARERLRPERRDGRLWHAYWHALIRARRPAP